MNILLPVLRYTWLTEMTLRSVWVLKNSLVSSWNRTQLNQWQRIMIPITSLGLQNPSHQLQPGRLNMLLPQTYILGIHFQKQFAPAPWNWSSSKPGQSVCVCVCRRGRKGGGVQGEGVCIQNGVMQLLFISLLCTCTFNIHLIHLWIISSKILFCFVHMHMYFFSV